MHDAGYAKVSTRNVVSDYLGGSDERARQAAEFIGPHLPQAKLDAPKVIAALVKEFATAESGYHANLRVALAAAAVDARTFGLVASTPAAWTKLQGQQVARAAEAERVDAWIGAAGEKTTVTGVVAAPSTSRPCTASRG